MDRTYSIDKAAYLLGVPEERMQQFVRQHLVDTVNEEGEERIPKSEIARLYPWVTEQNETPPPPEETATDATPPIQPDGGEATPGEPEAPEASLVAREAPQAPERSDIEVTDENLLEVFEEIKRYQSRIHGLTEKMKRLHVRVNRLQTVANGELARFWERASAVYPDIWSEDSLALEEREGKLYITRRTSEEVQDYKHRFQSLIKEGVRKGHLPPGFLGVFPDADGEEADEE